MQKLLWHIRNWLARYVRSRPAASEPPLRAELYSVEQLARHARALAASQPAVSRRGSNQLLVRLDQNEEILRRFNHSTIAVDPDRRITPAAEWLLDNFYLIEEQIQLARRHLPRGYSRELPRLVIGPSAGLPSVYKLVLELISHVDAQIDAEPLPAFIAAYPTVAALKLGELWAIPIMLRLGLIENLQRIATRVSIARANRDLVSTCKAWRIYWRGFWVNFYFRPFKRRGGFVVGGDKGLNGFPQFADTAKAGSALRGPATVYHITITRTVVEGPGSNQLTLDGQEIPGDALPLQDDRQEHLVEFRAGNPPVAASLPAVAPAEILENQKIASASAEPC